MDTDIPLEKTAVDVNIDDILLIDKWKRARPILEGIINKNVPRNIYGRNEWIIIYTATDGRIGTMATIENIKTVDELKDHLQQFDGLTVEGE